MLSAIFFAVRRALLRAALMACVLLVAPPGLRADSTACEPSPKIRLELETASAAVAGAPDFDHLIAPFLDLRRQHPNSLQVHERYQDTVQRYGIEGHLRALTEEYQVLSIQHPDEPMYRYLYARSLMGRNTASAIQQMVALLADQPDFSPAHRSLAEIYASDAFRNPDQAKVERDRFLALCPGSVLAARPGPLPEPSTLIDQAERVLAENGDPNRIAALALQGIRDDERRLQHIRPFDWYSVDFKRQSQRELQAKYWRLWSLQVRCYRRAGQTEKASDLLTSMDQRVAVLLMGSDPGYWDALATLARLYEEGNQKDLATLELGSMQQFLTAHPDPSRAAQLDDLRKRVDPPVH
jgi:hypothetical protein